jgi:tetratricopeptide (TPR) repeat protein
VIRNEEARISILRRLNKKHTIFGPILISFEKICLKSIFKGMHDEFVVLKQALKNFENKNFKKTVKLCDEGIKFFPHNFEFWSLKAICLHSLGKAPEGYELIKRSLQQNTKSGLSWHLYAIMLKNDKNFADSIKSMRNSLKFDDSNISLRKEMSSLMLICQDFESFLETRIGIFSNSNMNFINISNIAFGYFLNQFFLNYLIFIKYLTLFLINSKSVNIHLIEILGKNGHFIATELFSSVLKFLPKISSIYSNPSYVPKDFNEVYSASKYFYEVNDCNSSLKILFSLGDFNPFHERNLAYLECLINLKIAEKNKDILDISIKKILTLFKIEESCPFSDFLEKMKYFQSIELLYKLALVYYCHSELNVSIQILQICLKVVEEITSDFFEFINYSFKRGSFRNFTRVLTLNEILIKSHHLNLALTLILKLYLIQLWRGEKGSFDLNYLLKLSRKFFWKDHNLLSFLYIICISEKKNIYAEKIYFRLNFLGSKSCFKRDSNISSNSFDFVFIPPASIENIDYALYLKSELIVNPKEYANFITSFIKENHSLHQNNSVQIQNLIEKYLINL